MEAWKNYISENQYTSWLNAFDLIGDQDLITTYDLYRTPRIYILDNNKRIIAKDIEIEKLESYLLDILNK